MIVERVTGRASALVEPAVTLTRLTREHAQVRMGASVRGAIDLVRLGRELSALRGEPEPAPGDATFADAAIAALSGRLRLDEGCEQTAEAIVLELIERLKPVERRRPNRREKPRPRSSGGGAGRSLSGAAARDVVRERGRRTLPRDQLAQRHGQLEQVSPAVGRLDEQAFHDLLRTDPDAAVALLADLGAATDPQLRARRGGSPRGCSCAPGGSAPAPGAATGG